jgi:hypothetical protein
LEVGKRNAKILKAHDDAINGQLRFCRNYAGEGQLVEKKKKNHVRVSESLEISGSIDDGSLRRKKKKPCPSVGGSLEISGSIDDGSLGRKKKPCPSGAWRFPAASTMTHDHKAIHPGFTTSISDLGFRTSVLGPGRTDSQVN